MDKLKLKKVQLKEQHAMPVNLKDIRAGLVLDFPMNELGSTVIDQSQNGNNGTITGATRVQGLGDLRALSFDGVDDYVDLGITTSLVPTLLTALVWFKTSDVTYENYLIATAGTTGFLFGLNRDNTVPYNPTKISAYLWGVSSDWCDSDNLIVAEDKWYYATLTYDGATVKIYLNAVLVASKSETGIMTTLNTALLIGKRNTQYFIGKLCNIYIYNRALSAQEIRNLYLYIKKQAGLI